MGNAARVGKTARASRDRGIARTTREAIAATSEFAVSAKRVAVIHDEAVRKGESPAQQRVDEIGLYPLVAKQHCPLAVKKQSAIH